MPPKAKLQPTQIAILEKWVRDGAPRRWESPHFVLGVGGRRVVLRLVGQKAPHQLQAALNVNDVFTARRRISAPIAGIRSRSPASRPRQKVDGAALPRRWCTRERRGYSQCR